MGLLPLIFVFDPAIYRVEVVTNATAVSTDSNYAGHLSTLNGTYIIYERPPAPPNNFGTNAL